MERHRRGRPPADHVLSKVDEAMLARLVPEAIRIRALDLFLLGRVERRLVSGARLLGEVRGTRGVYRTVVHVLRSPEGPDAAGQCECPRRTGAGLCKHAVALLYAWIHEPDTFASIDRRLQILEERPRGELLELIRRLVEEEPALLEELDAAVPPPALQDAPGPTAAGASAPSLGEVGDARSAPARTRQADGSSAQGAAPGPGPAGPGPAAPAPAGPAGVRLAAQHAARPAAWLLELERKADPDAETLDRWADALEASPGEAGPAPAVAAVPTGIAARLNPEPVNPGAAARATLAPAPVPSASARRASPTSPQGEELRHALTLAVTGIVWRQAGLALAARTRGELAAAGWLLRRWEAAARLLTRLEACRSRPAPQDPPVGTPAPPGGLPTRALASIAVTAAALGPEALLAGSRFFRETGRHGAALSLARRALARAREPNQLAAARDAVAEAWLARGHPDRAVPYLAANFADQPDPRRLEALEAAARAAGQWETVAPAVYRHLEQRADRALLVDFLLRREDWDRLAAWLEQPEVRSGLPTHLLVTAADSLRRPAPGLAATLYREAMARPDAGSPRDLAARWAALQHRLGSEGTGPPSPAP